MKKKLFIILILVTTFTFSLDKLNSLELESDVQKNIEETKKETKEKNISETPIDEIKEIKKEEIKIEEATKEEEIKFLDLNKVYSEKLKVEENIGGVKFFRFEVPEYVFGIKIELSNSKANLNMYLNGDTIEVDSADMGATSSFNEEIILDRYTKLKLEDGFYSLAVVYDYPQLPIIENKKSNEIEFNIEIKNFWPKYSTIQKNNPVRFSLSKENSYYKFLKYRTNSDANCLRVDSFNCDSDVDIYIFDSTNVADINKAIKKAESFSGNETIIIDNSKKPFIKKNSDYYILIRDQYSENDLDNKNSIDSIMEVSVSVTDSKDIPYIIKKDFNIPFQSDGMENAIHSVVEILCENSSGSGVIVTPNGYVLTAYHILTGGRNSISDKILMAITLDEKKPAKEMFKLKVVYYDKEKDIALLKISSGIFNQKISDDIKLPYLDSLLFEDVKIGQSVYAFGFPDVGGLKSKNSITVSTGIISGFRSLGKNYLIKTDALADQGSSGGAIVDDFFRVVGISTSIVVSNFRELTFAYPISMLPSKWKILISNNR